MKSTSREIEKNSKLLKNSLNSVHDHIKIHTYWLLLEEVMKDNLENIDYVRDRWNLFNNERVKRIQRKYSDKGAIINKSKKTLTERIDPYPEPEKEI